MNCPKCGTLNDTSAKFCMTCGYSMQVNNQSQPMTNQLQIGTITIIRPKNFYGCLIDYDVYIDNYFMGSIPNGEQRTFQLYFGMHQVIIKQGLGSGSQQILINEQTRNLVFNCSIKMGLLNNTIEFNLINYTN